MTKLDSIWSRARDDLVVTSDTVEQDVLLWEHSSRVARSAQQIAKFPIVQERSPDELAIVATGLYHEAAWSVLLRNGEATRADILIRPPSESHREQGASLMERSLRGLIPPESLKRASHAIRALNDRQTNSIEAQVVADADNLDEFGLLVFWPTIRRGTLDGKGVKAAIDTWHRRREYQFWTARINDSFRFAPVRELARERLAKYDRAMRDLEEHHEGTDIGMAHRSDLATHRQGVAPG